MTDKQFNYILRRLRVDILRSLNDKAVSVRDESMYEGYSMIVTLADVQDTLDLYFEELIEND